MAINDSVRKEIQRKASQGIALQKPTEDKQALYDQFQSGIKREIERKAKAGIDMVSSNPWKEKIYQQFSKPSFEDETRTRIGAEVKNWLDNQTSAINDSLARQQQANSFAIQGNNQFLQEQLKKFQEQKNVNDQQSTMLQNRRGGFYSGGLDYQLGQNAKATQEASGALSRDVAQRNAQIYAQNSMLAEQAANQIKQLQQQAPDLVRTRVQEALDRYRQQNMQEAGLTGVYNGQQTLQAQNQQFSQQMAQDQFQHGVEQDQIANENWLKQFNEGVRQFGINNALRWATENRIASNQGGGGQSYTQQVMEDVNLNPARQRIEQVFLDETGQVTDPKSLYQYITGLGYNGNQTRQLINEFGLQGYEEQYLNSLAYQNNLSGAINGGNSYYKVAR